MGLRANDKLPAGPKCNDWTNDNTFDINIANTKCYYDLGIGQSLKADPGSEPGQYCMYMYQLNDQGTCDCIIDHVAFEIKADSSNCFPYPTGHKAYSFEKMPIVSGDSVCRCLPTWEVVTRLMGTFRRDVGNRAVTMPESSRRCPRRMVNPA